MTHETLGKGDWKLVLKAQGRSIGWLADATQSKRSTVYAYSCGARVTPDEWLTKVWTALGMPEVVERGKGGR